MTNLTFRQILTVVEWSGRQELSRFFIVAALVFFTVLLSVAGAYSVVMIYRRSREAKHSVAFSLSLVAIILCIARAAYPTSAEKNTPHANIVWDTYIYDDGSVATNDWPRILWRYDPWSANDILHIDARPKSSTNAEDWVQYYVGSVSDTYWSGYMPACTGMTIFVWSEYVPPSPVLTNGVYYVKYLSYPIDYTHDDDSVRMWTLLRTPIFDANGKRLMSPPVLPEPLNVAIPQELLNSFLNNEMED